MTLKKTNISQMRETLDKLNEMVEARLLPGKYAKRSDYTPEEAFKRFINELENYIGYLNDEDAEWDEPDDDMHEIDTSKLLAEIFNEYLLKKDFDATISRLQNEIDEDGTFFEMYFGDDEWDYITMALSRSGLV